MNGAILSQLWVEDFLLGSVEKVPCCLRVSFEWEESLISQVREYCDGLDRWVWGHEAWSFEGKRYFANKCPEIQQTRWMFLLPKEYTTEIGADHVYSSLL